MNILNKKINHIRFGEGKVTKQEENRIFIDFSGQYGIKEFVYPDGFKNYLKLEDAKLQAAVLDDLNRKDMHAALAKMEIQRQFEEEELRKAAEKKLETAKKRTTRKPKVVKEAEVKAEETAI